MFLIILLNLLYSNVFIVGKFALEVSQPFFLTGVRMLFAGLVSMIIYYWKYHNIDDIKSLTKSDWNLMFIIGVTNVYITNSFEFWGLQYLPSGKAAFIYSLSPFWMALLAYFLFSEKMTKQKWIGFFIGFVGFLPIIVGNSDVTDTTMRIGSVSLAEAAILFASFATAFGWSAMRILVRQHKFSTFLLNGITMFIGGICCLIHSFFFEASPVVDTQAVGMFLSCAIFMSLTHSVFAYNLHAFLLKKYTSTFISFSCFLCPIFAAFFGWIVLGEPITMVFVGCAIGVFTGLYVFYKAELDQGYIIKN